MEAIKGEIREEQVAEALMGDEGFSHDYLEEVLRDRVHLVSGNRSDLKHEGELRRFLFDFEDGRMRTHWEDRPYRKLYRRGLVGLRLKQDGRRLGGRFEKHVWRKLYAYHWVLPYPSVDVFTQTTKEGARMWYSMVTDAKDGCDLERIEAKGWRWGRKKFRDGVPEVLPAYVRWDKEEWVSWLEDGRERRERQSRVGPMVLMRF